MLKNIKIGKVLVISFLILAALVVIVGTAGLVELHSSNNNTKAIYNNGMVSVTQLTDVHQSLINVSSKGNAEIQVWVNETKAILDAYDLLLWEKKQKRFLRALKRT